MLAAVRGVIDFRQTRLLEPNWWRRFNILIDGMARDLDAQMTDAAYRYHLALVGNGQLTEESFKKAQERSVELYRELIESVKPWQKDNLSSSQRARETAREQYRQQIGNPDDPAVKAAIEAEIRLMREQMAATAAAPAVDDPSRELATRLAKRAQAYAAKTVQFD